MENKIKEAIDALENLNIVVETLHGQGILTVTEAIELLKQASKDSNEQTDELRDVCKKVSLGYSPVLQARSILDRIGDPDDM